MFEFENDSFTSKAYLNLRLFVKHILDYLIPSYSHFFLPFLNVIAQSLYVIQSDGTYKQGHTLVIFNAAAVKNIALNEIPPGYLIHWVDNIPNMWNDVFYSLSAPCDQYFFGVKHTKIE